MNERIIRPSVSSTLGQGAFWRTSVVLAVALTFAAVRSDASEPDLDAILAYVRDATGFAHLAHLDNGVLLTGKTRHYGNDGTYRVLFSPDGRFVERTEARLGSTVGFDGRGAW